MMLSSVELLDDDEDLLAEEFSEAVKQVQLKHSYLKNDDLISLYGLYKHITCGPCDAPKPFLLNTRERTKWSAWNSVRDIQKCTAMVKYIEIVKSVFPDWDSTKKEKSSWVSVSVPQLDVEQEILVENQTVFDFVKDNNIEKLKQHFIHAEINNRDDFGMCLIHWATDRNALEILTFLLEWGADVNVTDFDGQTALHYASSCGHIECIQMLLHHEADTTIQDKNNLTCGDVAYDENVLALLNQ